VALAIWNDSLLTSNDLVDEQHRELYQLVNDLHNAIVKGQDNSILLPTVDKLIKYTVEHFREEECLMKEVDYPGFEAHKHQHEELTRKVKEQVENYRTGKSVLAISLSSFMTKWLQHHVRQEDYAVVNYIRARQRAHIETAKS
jgi:hemerythrin